MRSSIATYVIGRSARADIVIGDATVSRLHAELVRGRNRTWYLTDRGSTGGTYLRNAGQWGPIRQDFIRPGDRLRFGEFESSLEDLLRRIPREGSTDGKSQGTELGAGSTDVDDRPRGPVRRDPATGDLIAEEEG